MLEGTDQIVATIVEKAKWRVNILRVTLAVLLVVLGLTRLSSTIVPNASHRMFDNGDTLAPYLDALGPLGRITAAILVVTFVANLIVWV